MDKVCGNCAHYLGGKYWDLRCEIEHPTRGEKIVGVTYPFGFLCCENTPACDMFEERLDNHN